jgi:hypothetical protein
MVVVQGHTSQPLRECGWVQAQSKRRCQRSRALALQYGFAQRQRGETDDFAILRHGTRGFQYDFGQKNRYLQRTVYKCLRNLKVGCEQKSKKMRVTSKKSRRMVRATMDWKGGL